MTYQMIQSVAVTGDIYQQFISYLLHESDTILLGTQNRERRLDGVPVSPTLIKQYEELQMFTILDVKWCQVEPDYLYGKAADVSGLQKKKRIYEKTNSEVLRKVSRYFPYSDAINESMVKWIEKL